MRKGQYRGKEVEEAYAVGIGKEGQVGGEAKYCQNCGGYFQADRQIRQGCNLKSHIESIIEDATYSCDQCEYKDKNKGNLKYTKGLSMKMLLTPVINVNTK